MSTNQEKPSHQPSLSVSDSAFPVLAIAVLSIIGTAFLLVSYYLLKRISTFRTTRQQDEDPFIAFSPSMWMNRGLEDSIIREIPIFQFKRGGERDIASACGCVVCLNEYQQHDMLRVLPDCGHAFHLECIDVWFQSNDNCPLCRSSILGTRRYPIDQIIAPSSSPRAYSDSLISNDEDFVVIELGQEIAGVVIPNRQQETEVSRPPMGQLEKKKKVQDSKHRKRNHHVSIMGDECIDVREKEEEFHIQPLRRSFSLDSAADRQLYLTVQKIIQRNERSSESSHAQESYNRTTRSMFSFGSKNAVLPVEFEL